MSRRVVITGLGPVSALGIGIDATWSAMLEGKTCIDRIQRFDPSGLPCHIAGEVESFKVTKFVPKSHRKATKVMARDIELAIVAADQAARDAQLITPGITPGTTPAPGSDPPSLSYNPARVGCHIGAGLVAADLEELLDAFIHATDEQGNFDMHKWGSEGMKHLTPLWLLKYLPNMLACHVTIVHGTQGPSNTITCAEASSELSIGESLRVIQRSSADACLCGGADSKLNPLGFLRQIMTNRVNCDDNQTPQTAVRPFCQTANGTITGEGGAIVVLEALETFKQRPDGEAYAELIGFGASQTVNRETGNHYPDAQGKAIAAACRFALDEAELTADDIDLVLPFGLGDPQYDQAEAIALKNLFGERLSSVPIVCPKAFAGNLAAGAGALDVCIGAKALKEQMIPARINCKQPLDGMMAQSAPATPASLRHVLTYSTSLGGQNAALILKRYEN